jgi:glycosyltransferase involved in cell wall biosynthesis
MPWRLAGLLARERAHVVHFNGLDFPFHARAVAQTGLPVLIQDHASSADSPIAWLRRWGHGRIAAAAFTSEAQAQPFLASGQLPRSARIFAIPESSSDFTPGDREAARRETGMFGAPALLWVGHLNANKNPLTILEAVRLALHELPDLHLWCAFRGMDLLDEVGKMLDGDEVLARHVHLLGPVPHAHVEQLCRASDFYVSASRREGSGYALIEALSCGAVPVVSDIPSFRALTDGGAIGALAAPGDAAAFAAAIRSLAALPREPLRRRVLDHFERRLSFERVGASLVQAYAAIAGAGPP